MSSYNAASGSTVVNQVQRAYNGLGQLTQEWQATSGTVNTGTTPSVQYAYSFAPSGSTNHSRPTSVTYPNGRVINDTYDTSVDGRVSRVSTLGVSGTAVEGYDYLGLDTVVKRGHAGSGLSNVTLSLYKLTDRNGGQEVGSLF